MIKKQDKIKRQLNEISIRWVIRGGGKDPASVSEIIKEMTEQILNASKFDPYERNWTVNEIKEELKKRNINFKNNLKRNELIDLIVEDRIDEYYKKHEKFEPYLTHPKLIFNKKDYNNIKSMVNGIVNKVNYKWKKEDLIKELIKRGYDHNKNGSKEDLIQSLVDGLKDDIKTGIDLSTTKAGLDNLLFTKKDYKYIEKYVNRIANLKGYEWDKKVLIDKLNKNNFSYNKDATREGLIKSLVEGLKTKYKPMEEVKSLKSAPKISESKKKVSKKQIKNVKSVPKSKTSESRKKVEALPLLKTESKYSRKQIKNLILDVVNKKGMMWTKKHILDKLNMDNDILKGYNMDKIKGNNSNKRQELIDALIKAEYSIYKKMAKTSAKKSLMK